MYSRLKWMTILSVILVLAMAIGVSAERIPMAEAILVERENLPQVVEELRQGSIDVYAHAAAEPAVFEIIQGDPDLDYYETFGSYAEFTFNPVGPEFNDGRFNPFNNKKIREAMNWIIDRDYIAQELYEGLAVPKLTVLNPAFADYSRVVEKANELEQKYAYDFEKAAEIVTAEMEAMGAELINDQWHYKGQPVVLKFLIRSEDAKLPTGDYFASQLERIGFATERDYRTGAEASPIWLTGDPYEGQWHVYTGAWGSPVVYRSQVHNFDQMYTGRVMPYPVFQELTPDPELDDLADRLARSDFSSMEERNEMLARTLELALEDSARIYTVDVLGYVPRRADVSVASDLGGNVAGTMLWPMTFRRGDEVDFTARIAMPQILVDPWNPVAGSNSAYDQAAIRATMERSIMTDPYTGNYWANRIERADIFVKKGLPVEKTLDWVDLTFVDEIVVPGDALVDWDAANQRFITVAEKFPEGVTANRRSVVYFPYDFYDTVKWHDGSPISFGDVMFWIILGYDRGKPESPIFDEAEQATLEAALRSSRGFRILSQDPLIIESFSDSWSIDAEFMYGEYFPVNINLGSGPWHTIALGIMAELDERLAFSSNKANQLQVDQMGFHTGPAIPILAENLEKAQAEGYIPYENVLGQYISADEAASRYANLQDFYNRQRHFWVGTGPMYLDRVYPVEKMIVLKRFDDHPDPADKWMMFGEPHIPQIEISRDGAAPIRQGSVVTFNVDVTFDGEPYAIADLVDVQYVIRDASGATPVTGSAIPVTDGKYIVQLSSAQTERISVGSTTLDVIVLSKLVGGATTESVQFVTIP